MAFLLARGAKNVVTEVQRWQYFLRRQGLDQVGAIDGDFGMNTEVATKFFQVKAGLSPSGKLDDKTLTRAQAMGYSVLPDDHYQKLAAKGGPAKPGGLQSPSDKIREKDFGCFKFTQLPLAQRPRAEAIVIKGSCAGSAADWIAENIVTFDMPQLRFAVGYHGKFRCHEAAEPVFRKVFAAWEGADLLHLIISYAGCFEPRYKFGKAPPGASGHGSKSSKDVSDLSNHSFGSAFDINATQNWIGDTPADWGAKGCVRELVAIANKHNIYWGGHFTQPLDGMHFEISAL
ncbi:M15 family metallopeptidase [Belnapia rosea]|uniref:Putative peptidoglycan binding domain-containing protein n=1 Tax=Belnapia rosea TaxID=938405 RepID=A0A1G6RIY1_9PROT|nr:M15 family metallopeptidase [Belnapia rosea]SDD04610.1 Putative peptidoglycan binding domain-containing protein [Belnapia rosea]